MIQAHSASDRIAALKAEIEELQQSAILELKERRKVLKEEIAQVEASLAELTGEKPVRSAATQRTRRAATPPRNLPLQDLKELLALAPEKTVNIRRENLDLRNIKVLANANPHLLKLGGNGAWPTVTLLK